jgi:hypothetical protein
MMTIWTEGSKKSAPAKGEVFERKEVGGSRVSWRE